MKKIFISLILVFILFIIVIPTVLLIIPVHNHQGAKNNYKKRVDTVKAKELREIKGTIKKGETLSDIFEKYRLNVRDLFSLREASANIHQLRNLQINHPYRIMLDENNKINSFTYWIDDNNILNIKCGDNGFCAEKTPIHYEQKVECLSGVIKENLVSSLGQNRNGFMLALDLSDIFASDIDFASDIKNGDTFKVVVEGFFLNGKLKKYGNILSAEIENNGEIYRAYRFSNGEHTDYYDSAGKSLKKAFLKAPMNFKHISSTFSKGRRHPVLKIYRPHYGIDYAAPMGTPVSAAGDGEVVFSGRNGQFGNLIVLQHLNGYKTYYGHLSKIASTVYPGKRVEQGMIIGQVGSTGSATGPHLHYEMRMNNTPVNPLSIKIPKVNMIPEKSMAEFNCLKNAMDIKLASIPVQNSLAVTKKEQGNEG
ncbi:MAG: peptidoglycan DD-metalloendopeptidase family protein [Smithella sp.]